MDQGRRRLNEVEGCIARSNGHCMVMGTASTMASMAEALGMTLPGNAAIPAADSRRYNGLLVHHCFQSSVTRSGIAMFIS